MTEEDRMSTSEKTIGGDVLPRLTMTTTPPPPEPEIVPGTSRPIPVDPVTRPGDPDQPQPQTEPSTG